MTATQVWEQAAADQSRRVVGWVPGYGVFDMRQGVIHRLFGGTRNEIGTYRRATSDELTELDWAAAHGCLQIEIRPVSGLCGSAVASGRLPTEILWQATGALDGCDIPVS